MLKGSLLEYNSIALAEGEWSEKAYWDATERARERDAAVYFDYGALASLSDQPWTSHTRNWRWYRLGFGSLRRRIRSCLARRRRDDPRNVPSQSSDRKIDSGDSTDQHQRNRTSFRLRIQVLRFLENRTVKSVRTAKSAIRRLPWHQLNRRFDRDGHREAMLQPIAIHFEIPVNQHPRHRRCNPYPRKCRPIAFARSQKGGDRSCRVPSNQVAYSNSCEREAGGNAAA